MPERPNIGKHKVHLNMDMQCKDCHKPHVWRVTEASAKKDCVKPATSTGAPRHSL